MRVGIVGLGYWGPKLLRNFRASSRFRVAALCDLRSEALIEARRLAPEAQGFSDYDAFLAETDLVVVATPAATHFELTLRALEADCHVFVEKPMAHGHRQCLDLLELARRRKRFLGVNHTFLFSGPVRCIAEILAREELGKLWYYDSVRTNLGMFRHDTNVLWDMAAHDLAILDAVLPRGPKSMRCFGVAHTPSGLHDQAYLSLDYGDSLVAQIHVNWLTPVKIRRTMFGGARQTLLYDAMDPSEPVRVYDQGGDLWRKKGTHRAARPDRIGEMRVPWVDPTEALAVLVDSLGASLFDGLPFPSDGEAGARVVRLLEAADEALATGGVVELST